MVVRCTLAVAATFAAILALSFPSHAGPKSDCETGIVEAEKALENSTVSRKKIDNVERILRNARKLRKAKKFKKCVEVSNNAKFILGATK